MAKKKSYRGKKQYGSYDIEGRWLKNKIRKLTALCKKFPNNLPAKKRLDELLDKGASCTRKAPQNPHWTPGTIVLAQETAMLGLNGNIALVPRPLTGGDEAAKKSRELYSMDWSKAMSKRAQNDGRWKANATNRVKS